MNNFPDYSKLPKYKKLRKEQKASNEIVSDEDLPPFIFNDFLSLDELLYIQNLIKNTPENKIVLTNWNGQAGIQITDSDPIFSSISKKIQQFSSDAYGEELELLDLSLAKYSSSFGWEVKLYPHYDSRSIETLVFDLQISSNHKWDIVVEGQEYDLKNGQAILFSGTNQIHWRENKEIQPEQETILMFAFLKHKKERQLNNNSNMVMKKRQERLIKETGISQERKEIKKDIDPGFFLKRTPLTHKGRYGNIFTTDEIDLIYKTIDLNSINNTTEVKIYGQKVWFQDMPTVIKDKVMQQMKIIHNQNVKLEEIAFARYSKEYSDIPALTPHYDNTFMHPRVTLDVQLKANVDWTIVVEDHEIKLQDNMAAAFSGTHQVHWRKPLEFKDGDFVDMLFCHFSLENSLPITLEEKQRIESNMMRFSNKFSVDLMKENLDLKQTIRKYSGE